jgi:hypothetical protein
MTPKKNPTNSDIYKKLDHMDIRINALESWKIAEDAARKAVSDYRSNESARERDKNLNSESYAKREVLKQTGYILGLLSLALYVYLSTRGVHP